MYVTEKLKSKVNGWEAYSCLTETSLCSSLKGFTNVNVRIQNSWPEMCFTRLQDRNIEGSARSNFQNPKPSMNNKQKGHEFTMHDNNRLQVVHDWLYKHKHVVYSGTNHKLAGLGLGLLCSWKASKQKWARKRWAGLLVILLPDKHALHLLILLDHTLYLFCCMKEGTACIPVQYRYIAALLGPKSILNPLWNPGGGWSYAPVYYFFDFIVQLHQKHLLTILTTWELYQCPV